MCTQSYAGLSRSAKRDKAIGHLKAYGVSEEMGVALIALSEGETGYTWLLDRPFASPELEKCCATFVGLEAGFFDPAVKASPGMLGWLSQHGYVKSGANGKLSPAGSFGNPFKPWATMAALEYAIMTQDIAALQMFSIGPTQMHLRYFAIREGWPKDWEELEWYYTAGGAVQSKTDEGDEKNDIKRAGYIADRWLTYLTPTRFNTRGALPHDFPVPDGSPGNSVAWLTKHAGNAGTAAKIYEGQPLYTGDQRRAYKTVWPEVKAAWATVPSAL